VVIRKITGDSVEIQPVKRRLGAWCEMAASVAVVSLELSSEPKAVKIEPKSVNLKNLHC
jgi:hypothetical protein